MLNMPILITKEKADNIIETLEPKGKFLMKDGLAWVAIDNECGEATTEEFQTFESALEWLNSDREDSDEIKLKDGRHKRCTRCQTAILFTDNFCGICGKPNTKDFS